MCKSQGVGFFHRWRPPNYGVLINSDVLTLPEKIHSAKILGVTYYRHAVTLDEWDGAEPGLLRLQDSGLNVVCNYNYSAQSPAHAFPTNMLGYADTLRLALNYFQPDLVVIENEEINSNYHTTTAPISDYITMLQTAAPIARRYTSQTGKPLKLTNGGVYGNGLYVLTFRWLKANLGQASADTFANRCMQPSGRNAANTPCSNATFEANAADVQMVLDAAKNGYIDYVNIHPYEVLNPNFTDAQDTNFIQITKWVLRQIKNFVEITTGKPIITNETGQRHNEQPLLVTRILQNYFSLGFKYMIWFSGDSEDGAGARSLFNPNGSIRPNGTAFQTYIYNLKHQTPP